MISIRKIKPADNAQVRELIDEIMRDEFGASAQAYARHDLDDPAAYYSGAKDVFLVAEKDGKIIGTVAIKEDSPDTALLRRVFVRREFRGKGYGDRLMRSALKFCFARHYQNINFRGTDKMQKALKLCLKQGFHEENIVATDAFRMFVLTKKIDPEKTS